MIKKIQQILKKKQFQSNLQKEKSKIYFQEPTKQKFRSKRNKYKLFLSKLEFENTFEDIKKYNIAYIFLGIFLISASLYILFFSHYFTIKSIDIIREDDGINIDLSYRSIEKYRYRPIFFTPTENIENNLISYQPNIQKVEIRKIIPDNLKITLKSYDKLFSFHYNDKEYIITENGVMIPENTHDENLQKISIIGIPNNTILDYKKVFNQGNITNIYLIIQDILQNNSFVEVEKILFYTKEQEAHIFSNNGIRIIFDLQKDYKVQGEKLKIFYKQYLSTINTGIVYIDLRINERIIYCGKQSEFQCNQNIKSIYGE